MKPLNLDNRPCNPISSNCVIWQGPDIPCIKLCTGDTVSDIVFKLATELCEIMDQLKVSNYDLSCLNLTACPPEDFQALIQLLIDKICELNGIPTGDSKSASGCPDCVVSVVPCLIENGQTTMQLIDYVQMIANRVCSIISEIVSINDQITVINSTLVDLQYQIDNLPTYTLPKFSVNCILPGEQYLDVIVETLINDNSLGYCRLLSATGNPADINTAVLSQCITDTDQPLAALPAVNTFSAYYSGSWVNAAALGTDPTVANAINNIWIAICDIYNYVKDLSLSVTDTTTVNLTYTSGVLSANIQDTGWQCLDGFDWYGANVQGDRPQCRRIGNVIYFRGNVMIPLTNAGGGSTGAPLTWNYISGAPGTDTYFGVYAWKPATTGAGSVTLNPGGSITFNQGNPLIPVSVVPLSQNFDGSYTSNYIIASRLIKIYDNVAPFDTPTYSSMLNTLVRVIFTSDKKMVFQLVKDSEISAGSSDGTQVSSTSVINNVISHVREGEYVPKYQSASSVTSSSPNSGTTHTITLPAPLAPDTQYVNNTKLDFDSTLTYPFSCDANDQNQLGGFGFVRLDGMSAFIGPCITPSIASPVLDSYACAGTCVPK